MTLVYLNGQWLAPEKAQVSVLDRGFIFGDGVYELIPCYGGAVLRLDEHLQRLNNSLNAIRLQNPMTHDQWRNIIGEMVEKNGGGDLSIYLQVTRGVAPRDHALPVNIEPTVLVMAKPLPETDPVVIESGTAVICLEDIRWRYCHIKAISLLPNVLLRQQALDAGATEAILIREGLVTEGAASNVFMVNDYDDVITPPKSQFLLPGITRDLILELAREAGLQCKEEPITSEQLHAAKEVWISSSLREVQAVTSLDGATVGDGKPGPVWRRVFDAFQHYKTHTHHESAS